MSDGGAALLAGFADPPPGHGPVPFWWWVGGRLDPERLCRQLDALREKGVFAAIVSYNHHADGTTDVGDPAIFSDAWWTIFLAVLDHARATGMTIGIQDYSLLKPMLKAIGAAEPALRGAELRHVAAQAEPGRAAVLEWPAGATLIEATAWARGETIDLAGRAVGNRLSWAPARGRWQVAAVFAVPAPFDPLHPRSGARSLAAFQERIAGRVGDHLGTTLTMFFQDELDFGARWPFWSPGLASAFAAAKGYPLRGRLAELWMERGPATTKLRLDFADVAVGLLEAHYFAPVHRWHEAHGCLFGHDNAGRGAIAVGRDFYGDYMRTMRWYSAPGSDDPDLRGERAFKGLKVAGSIAALYDRPRVWAECFHSSGWGATPAQMLDGVNGVFALGATLVNLHGLYYTTAGSWWEWAPPDFHFRQPYWAGMAAFNRYVTRLSWLLSQGEQACDVAILYPSAALAGGLNAAVDPALAGPIPLSEAQRDDRPPPVDAAEAAAFAAARALFDAGVDFTFVDDASLAGGGGRWRTILLPEMTTIRWDSLSRLHAFAAAGGTVIALGALPRASDRAGAHDAVLNALVAELFGPSGAGVHLPAIGPDFAALVAPCQVRDARGCGLQRLHRRIGDRDIWFLRNPRNAPVEAELRLRGIGGASVLDAWTGTAEPIAGIADGETHTRVRVALPASGAVVVMIDPGRVGATSPVATAPPQPAEEIRRLDRDWSFALVPTMDNRFGDFAASAGMVGAEIPRFDWCEGEAPDVWRPTAPGHAPRLLVLGPVAPADRPAWEAAVAGLPPGAMPPPLIEDGATYPWRDYAFSTRDGILDDPFLKHWSSGPHGLKGIVPDDYIDLDGAPGDSWYITAALRVAAPGPARIAAGSRAGYRLWLDGAMRIDQPVALPPGRLPEWGLPHYAAPARHADIAGGAAGTRLLLRIAQPEGQRTRAHIGLAATPVPAGRRLRWFAGGALALEPFAAPARPQWFRFAVPPGATRLALAHRGTIAAWRGDAAMAVTTRDAADGARHSRLVLETIAERAGDVIVRIVPPAGCRAGDCILSPIRSIDPQGPIRPGDWAMQGLGGYSGGVVYSRAFYLDAAEASRDLLIDTGPVGAMARVVLNGRPLGWVFAPPWRLPLGDAARIGANRLAITVFNTLANHYDQATPTPYVFPGQTVSGLLHAPLILAR